MKPYCFRCGPLLYRQAGPFAVLSSPWVSFKRAGAITVLYVLRWRIAIVGRRLSVRRYIA